MATGGIQSVNSNQSSSESRQLNFEKAMNDFKMMFPSIEVDVIEMVLRSNNGLVDATVDQLLTMQDQCSDSNNEELLDPSLNVRLPSYNDPSLNKDDPPPAYTPRSEDEQILYDPHDLLVHHIHTLQATIAAKKSQANDSPTLETKDWNPPMLGSLPNDFLRLNISAPSSPNQIQTTNTEQPSTTTNSDMYNTTSPHTRYSDKVQGDHYNYNGLDTSLDSKSSPTDKGKGKKFGQMSRKFKRKKTKSNNKKEYQQMSSDTLVEDDSEGEGGVPR